MENLCRYRLEGWQTRYHVGQRGVVLWWKGCVAALTDSMNLSHQNRHQTSSWITIWFSDWDDTLYHQSDGKNNPSTLAHHRDADLQTGRFPSCIFIQLYEEVRRHYGKQIEIKWSHRLKDVDVFHRQLVFEHQGQDVPVDGGGVRVSQPPLTSRSSHPTCRTIPAHSSNVPLLADDYITETTPLNRKTGDSMWWSLEWNAGPSWKTMRWLSKWHHPLGRSISSPLFQVSDPSLPPFYPSI